MHKLLVILMVIVLFSANAFADVSGKYVNRKSDVDVKQQGKVVKFSINSSMGQGHCELEGMATMIDANRAAYSSEDKCVVVLNFAGSGLKVTTKDCDGSCGMGAEGAMDGKYRKK